MKIRCAFALVVLAACTALCQDAYKLSIDAESEVVSGEPVTLLISMENQSGHSVECCPVENYLYYVYDSGGHPVERTSSPSGVYRATLKAGKTVNGSTSLIWFDLTKPDTYTVQLGWRMAPNEVIKSNTISVTVTPRTPYTLKLLADLHYVVKVGHAIPITIVKTNRSDRDIDCSSTPNIFTELDDKYQYDIRDSNGNLVPRRTVKMYEPGDPYPWSGTKPCKPNSFLQSAIDPAVAYDMSQPGIYTIQVSDGEVKSNKVTVTVVP